MSEQVSFVAEHYDNDALAEANEQLGLVVARLYAENAGLRKLVADMWRELAAACAEQVTSYDTLREFSDRIRELEVNQ